MAAIFTGGDELNDACIFVIKDSMALQKCYENAFQTHYEMVKRLLCFND